MGRIGRGLLEGILHPRMRPATVNEGIDRLSSRPTQQASPRLICAREAGSLSLSLYGVAMVGRQQSVLVAHHLLLSSLEHRWAGDRGLLFDFLCAGLN